MITTYATAQSNKYPPVPPPERETANATTETISADKPPVGPPVKAISRQEIQDSINKASPQARPPAPPVTGRPAEGNGGIKEETIYISSPDKNIQSGGSIRRTTTIKTEALSGHTGNTNVTAGKITREPYQKK